MVESFRVMDAMKVVYAAYFLAICVFFVWFAIRLVRKGKVTRKFNVFFGCWMVLLVVFGVAYHLSSTVWAPWETLLYEQPTPDVEIPITVANHQFSVTTQNPIVVKQGELVKFEVASKDLVYGFGLFSADERMLFQMQVDPSTKNNLLWKFDQPGTYSIRSTEYSGPAEYSGPNHQDLLYVKDGVRVIPNS